MKVGTRKSLLSGQQAKERESKADLRQSNVPPGTSPRYTRLTRATTKVDIPMRDYRSLLQYNRKRSEADQKYVGEFEEKEHGHYFTYHPKHDAHDIGHVDPSYTKFKVPMEVTCRERMKKDFIRYNSQFNSEISKLIDYQNTALEAAYFVRMMAYTTLWPPYHSNLEITKTNRTFYRLSKKEEARLSFIMSREFC